MGAYMNIHINNFIRTLLVITFSFSFTQIAFVQTTNTQTTTQTNETITVQENADGYTKTKEKSHSPKPPTIKPKNQITVLTKNPKIASSIYDVTENMQSSSKNFFYKNIKLVPTKVSVKNNTDKVLSINKDSVLKYNMCVKNKVASHTIRMQMLLHSASKYLDYLAYLSGVSGAGFVGYQLKNILVPATIEFSNQALNISAQLINPYVMAPAGLVVFTLNKLDKKYSLSSTTINNIIGLYHQTKAENFQAIYDIKNVMDQPAEVITIQPEEKTELLIFVTPENKIDLWNNNIQPELNYQIIEN